MEWPVVSAQWSVTLPISKSEYWHLATNHWPLITAFGQLATASAVPMSLSGFALPAHS
jgi:hypothetical protein